MRGNVKVRADPSNVNTINMRFLRPPTSARAPSNGAIKTTIKLATAFAAPKKNVLSVASKPPPQYCLNKRGKKPAITAVAYAEFAQSYMAHEKIFLLVNLLGLSTGGFYCLTLSEARILRMVVLYAIRYTCGILYNGIVLRPRNSGCGANLKLYNRGFINVAVC